MVQESVSWPKRSGGHSRPFSTRGVTLVLTLKVLGRVQVCEGTGLGVPGVPFLFGDPADVQVFQDGFGGWVGGRQGGLYCGEGWGEPDGVEGLGAGVVEGDDGVVGGG